jgi:arginyl-tRNA synthetase
MGDSKEGIKEEIAKLIAKEVKLKEKEIISLLEIPPNQELGDFAFPCFKLSQIFKKSPQEIAKQLEKEIKPKEAVISIKSSGPYLNFFIDKKLDAEKILKIDENFGKGKEGKHKEKILLEHTSINPNASPHVGRTRNSIIGDSIYRVLEFLGNKVERHYYVNDVSKQVAILSLYFKPKDTFDDLLNKYVKASKELEKNPELEKKVFELLHKFEHKDKKITELFKKIVGIAIEGQKKILSSIGIYFDYFDYESRYIDSAKIILGELEKTGKLFRDKENRLVLNQKSTGLEWKMKSPVLVLTRNDGTGLYPLRDLAYTIEKCKKGRNIIILGEDQKLYFEQIKQALILLKKPFPEVVHYSFVLLKDVGKMSTRRGEVVLLENFLKEAKKKAEEEIKKRKTKGDAMKIAVAAVKYSMLRNDNDKNITFDMENSLNFEGDTGPYLQYSYARASSILKKAKSTVSKTKEKLIIPDKLENSEIDLIKNILSFPEIVKDSAEKLNPSLIAHYAFSLAQTFSNFYTNCRVVGADEETKVKGTEAFRLALVKAFRVTMKNALFLLGIDVMDEM